MPARKSESRKAWDQFEADIRTVGRDFRRHYAGAGDTRRELGESVKKLAEAAEEVLDSLGRATRDPKVRQGTRKAARSFSELVAETLREVADGVGGTLKSRRR
jgi:hypothetical protein